MEEQHDDDDYDGTIKMRISIGSGDDALNDNDDDNV